MSIPHFQFFFIFQLFSYFPVQLVKWPTIGFSPDHQVFNNASKNFRVAAAEIQSAKGAADEIDRVLRECFVKSGPVYIFVPIDLVDVHVPSKGLQTPLDLEPAQDEKAVEEASAMTR